MTITSTAFTNGDRIPDEYTCQGDDINPALTFSEVPPEAESLVLILDDPDAPNGPFTHWMLYDISPALLQIIENAKPDTGVEGTNDFGKVNYGGPCPPEGEHRYFFRVFALDKLLHLHPGATRAELDAAMGDHIIEQAELMGVFSHGPKP